MVLLSISAMACCGLIAVQDFRERAVVWFLFPLLGILLGLMHLLQTDAIQFLWFTGANVLLLTGIILILFFHSTYILRKKFINVSLGAGDILFFYAFALGFPTMTFIILFAGSVLFSLVLFFVLKRIRHIHTVPLAGLMGLFLIAVFIIDTFPLTPSLYLF